MLINAVFKMICMNEPKNFSLVNNEKEMQLEVTLDGHKAYLIYRFYKKDIAFMHTHVPEELRGNGVASFLAKSAFAYAKSLHKPVMVYCPYIAKFLQTHEEYKTQLDKDLYN